MVGCANGVAGLIDNLVWLLLSGSIEGSMNLKMLRKLFQAVAIFLPCSVTNTSYHFLVLNTCHTLYSLSTLSLLSLLTPYTPTLKAPELLQLSPPLLSPQSLLIPAQIRNAKLLTNLHSAGRPELPRTTSPHFLDIRCAAMVPIGCEGPETET